SRDWSSDVCSSDLSIPLISMRQAEHAPSIEINGIDDVDGVQGSAQPLFQTLEATLLVGDQRRADFRQHHGGTAWLHARPATAEQLPGKHVRLTQAALLQVEEDLQVAQLHIQIVALQKVVALAGQSDQAPSLFRSEE